MRKRSFRVHDGLNDSGQNDRLCGNRRVKPGPSKQPRNRLSCMPPTHTRREESGTSSESRIVLANGPSWFVSAPGVALFCAECGLGAEMSNAALRGKRVLIVD